MMLGAGFGLPEVQELLTRELRAAKTSEVVWHLPDVTRLGRGLRESSGLVEFYRILMKSRNV
jgi:hypothetical protein